MGESKRYAGFWARFFAIVLDIAVIGSLMSVADSWFFEHVGSMLAVSIKVCIFFFYFFACTFYFNQTLGKIIIGIKVVTATQSKLNWEDVLIREVIGKVLSFLLCFIGFLATAVDPQKQALHDKLTNMYVIWEK